MEDSLTKSEVTIATSRISRYLAQLSKFNLINAGLKAVGGRFISSQSLLAQFLLELAGS